MVNWWKNIQTILDTTIFYIRNSEQYQRGESQVRESKKASCDCFCSWLQIQCELLLEFLPWLPQKCCTKTSNYKPNKSFPFLTCFFFGKVFITAKEIKLGWWDTLQRQCQNKNTVLSISLKCSQIRVLWKFYGFTKNKIK